MPASSATDFFALLGLEPCFSLDPAALHEAYLARQRQYHPDRIRSASPLERTQALQRSADVNQAYRLLKEPLTRAEYLLAREGVHVGGERDSVKPAAALLMESMELRERLMEQDGPQALDALRHEAEQLREQTIASFETAYGQDRLLDAAQAALRWRFIEKFLGEIQAVAKKTV